MPEWNLTDYLKETPSGGDRSGGSPTKKSDKKPDSVADVGVMFIISLVVFGIFCAVDHFFLHIIQW